PESDHLAVQRPDATHQITSSRTSTQWNATTPNITRATRGITRDSRTSRLNATYNQSRQRDQHTKESRRQQTPARQTIGESRSVGGSGWGLRRRSGSTRSPQPPTTIKPPFPIRQDDEFSSRRLSIRENAGRS